MSEYTEQSTLGFSQDKSVLTAGDAEIMWNYAEREPEPRWSLRDEGRSDGHGESYGERNA